MDIKKIISYTTAVTFTAGVVTGAVTTLASTAVISKIKEKKDKSDLEKKFEETQKEAFKLKDSLQKLAEQKEKAIKNYIKLPQNKK